MLLIFVQSLLLDFETLCFLKESMNRNVPCPDICSHYFIISPAFLNHSFFLLKFYSVIQFRPDKNLLSSSLDSIIWNIRQI